MLQLTYKPMFGRFRQRLFEERSSIPTALVAKARQIYRQRGRT